MSFRSTGMSDCCLKGHPGVPATRPIGRASGFPVPVSQSRAQTARAAGTVEKIDPRPAASRSKLVCHSSVRPSTVRGMTRLVHRPAEALGLSMSHQGSSMAVSQILGSRSSGGAPPAPAALAAGTTFCTQEAQVRRPPAS